MKGKVKIVNEGERFDADRYGYLLGDIDGDGNLNVDDKYPFDRNKSGNVEGSPLSESIIKLIDLKEDLDETMYDTVDKLTSFSPNSDVFARTKTPFSIINKLVKKRLLDPNKGLTDLVGTTIAVDDFRELQKVRKRIKDGELGTVLEEEDFYTNPLNGYVAYHFIILSDGNQIEVQVKTKRTKAVNELSHEAYKRGVLDVKNLEYLMDIVQRADKGEERYIKIYDGLMSDKSEVKKMLTKKMEQGGALSDLDQMLQESTYEGTSLPYTFSVTNTGTTPASASISPVSVMAKGGEIKSFKDFKDLLDKTNVDSCKGLECDGATRVLNYIAKEKGIEMIPKSGAIYLEREGNIVNGFEPHQWNEIIIDDEPYIVDYKARMWMGEDAPHGVFKKEDAKKMGYEYIGDSVSLNPEIAKLILITK